MNRLLIVAAAVVALVAAAVLVAPGFVDWNRYRGAIAERLESAIGRQIEIAGDVHFTLIPSPSISVADVRIANPAGSAVPNLLSLASLDVDLAFGALLRGEFQLREVVLREPVLALEVLPGGGGNWSLGNGGGGGPDVAVDSFLVRGGTVTFRDEARGVDFRIEGLDAEITAETLAGPFTARGEFEAAGLPFTFNFASGALGAGRPAGVRLDAVLASLGDRAVVRGTVSGGAGDWTFRGDARFEGEDLAAALAIAAERLRGPALTEAGLNAPYSLAAGVVASPTEVALNDIDVRLADTTVVGAINVAFGASPWFDAALSISQLDLDAFLPQRGGEPAANAAPWMPDLPRGLVGTFNLTAVAVTLRERIVRGVEIAATFSNESIGVTTLHALLPGVSEIEGQGIIAEVDGAPQFDGLLSGRSDNGRELLAWLGLDPPDVPADRLRTLSWEGRIRLRPDLVQAYAFDAGIDTTRVTGAVAVALRDRPAFSVDVDIDRVNVDSYLRPAPAGGDGEDGAAFPVAILDEFDTDIRVRVGEITVRDELVRGLIIDAGLLGGVLTAREVSVAGAAGASGTLTGIATGFSGGVGGTGTINISAPDPSGLARLAGLPEAWSPERLGAFRFNARLDGDQDNLSVDMGAELAGMDVRLQGALRGLAGGPVVDLAFAATHPNLAALLATVGIGTAASGSGGAFDMRGTVEGALGGLDVGLVGEVAGATLRAAGSVALAEGLAFDVSFTAAHPDVPEYVHALGLPYRPAEELGAASLRATLAGDSGAVTIRDLDAAVGGMELALNGELLLDGPRPRLVAEATAGPLDLDLLFPPPPPVPGPAARPDWSGEPLPFAALARFDLDLNVFAARIVYRDLDLEAPAFTLSVADGSARVEGLRAGLYGGELTLDAEVTTGALPAVHVSATLTEADLAQAPNLSWAFTPLSGSLRAEADLSAAGESERGLVSTVNGTLAASAEGGSVAGLSVWRIARGIDDLTDVAGLPDLLRAAVAEGETLFTTVDAKAIATDGVVTIDSLTADLDGAAMTGGGTVDLARRRTELDFTLVLKDQPGLPPFAMDVAGPWDAPRKSIRSRDLQGYVARRIADAALRELAPALPELTAPASIIPEILLPQPPAVPDPPPPPVAEQSPAAPAAPPVGLGLDQVIEGLFGAVAPPADSSVPAESPQPVPTPVDPLRGFLNELLDGAGG